MEALDLHEWTDLIYGNGRNSVIGAVLGRWEFTSGASSSATVEESIFMDLAKLHAKGKHGFLVYRAMRSVILDCAHTSTEYPTTIFKIFQKFNSFTTKQWSSAGMISPKTFKEAIDEWKAELGIGPSHINMLRLCPKAAWMALNGWDVFHAIAVSSKLRGTPVIGNCPFPWKLNFATL